MLRAMMALTLAGASGTTGDEALDPALRDLQSGLAEYPEVGDVAWVLRRGDDGTLRPEPIEVGARTRFGFPFIKPGGSQSAQLGTVIKRSRNAKREVSPGGKILASTLASFEETAARTEAPAAYGAALKLLGDDSSQRLAALQAALEAITAKDTCWVALGDPPGDDIPYARWQLDLLRAERYKLDLTAPPAPCPLCEETRPLAPNGLKGAGINFGNLDNPGMFPGFDEARAALRFALCGPCADRLRVFKNEVAEELKCRVAGEGALVIPEVSDPHTGRAAKRAREVVQRLREGSSVGAVEDALLRVLERESSVASFHVLWATLGQDLDDVTGLVMDVPRTRLAELSTLNDAANLWCATAQRPGSVLPRSPLRERLFDLSLSVLQDLTRHPGGARTKRLNNGQHLASFRRAIARAVYGSGHISAARWFRELCNLAQSYLREAVDLDEGALQWWLLYEDRAEANVSPDAGDGKKRTVRKSAAKAERTLRLTLAGWIRHAALVTRYLQQLKVLEAMESDVYVPAAERLRPFFVDSGVRGDARAFAFLLGALWGKLVTVQAARKVNVKANALSWLRRGALSGPDLPRLFALTRMKLLEYGTHSDDMGLVLGELAHLGHRLGDRIALDNDQTMYFLLLGEALATELMPAKTSKEP